MKNNKLLSHRRHKTISLSNAGKGKIEPELFSLTLIKFFLNIKAKVCALLKGEKPVTSQEDQRLVELSKAVVARVREMLSANALFLLTFRVCARAKS